MENFNFTSYTVTNGTAVPNVKLDYTFASRKQFEQWKQAHTYVTNAPDGVYPKECFEEPEWLCQNPMDGTWEITNEKLDLFDTRQFLYFKERAHDKQAGGETVLNEVNRLLHTDKYKFVHEEFESGFEVGFIEGSQWQSTHFSEVFMNWKDIFKPKSVSQVLPERDFTKDYNDAFVNGMQAFKDGKEYHEGNDYYELNLYPDDEYRNRLLFGEFNKGWWFARDEKEKEDRLLEIERLKSEINRLKST